MANTSQLSSVNFGGLVAFVTSANVTVQRNSVEIAGLGTSWVETQYGTARVSGTIEVLFDKTDHAAFMTQIAGANAAATMTMTWTTAESWSGSALITEVSPSASVDDVVKASISFVGTGVWTL